MGAVVARLNAAIRTLRAIASPPERRPATRLME
jgi:hypothetical protein